MQRWIGEIKMTKKLTESETLAVLEYVEVNGFGACAECPVFPCGNHCYRTITTNAINHMRAIRGETMCVTSRTAEERIQKLITQFNFEKDVMLKEMTRLANENFELKRFIERNGIGNQNDTK